MSFAILALVRSVLWLTYSTATAKSLGPAL